MITKLDHFSRSTIDAIKTGMKLFKKGVQTHILNIGLVEDTHPTRRLVFNVMNAFTEFERTMIV